MNNNELYHHGILGQKWGVRRFQKKDGTLTSAGKERYSDSSDTESIEKTKSKRSSSKSSKKNVKEYTDEELRATINRLELEKKYKELSKSEEQIKKSKGERFVMNIIEKSGENIGTQLVTYVMGNAVNKLAGDEIVNPKKGQRDKK